VGRHIALKVTHRSTFSPTAPAEIRLPRKCVQSARRGLASSYHRQTNDSVPDPTPLSTAFHCSQVMVFSFYETTPPQRSSVPERSHLCYKHGHPAEPLPSKGQCHLPKPLATLLRAEYPWFTVSFSFIFQLFRPLGFFKAHEHKFIAHQKRTLDEHAVCGEELQHLVLAHLGQLVL